MPEPVLVIGADRAAQQVAEVIDAVNARENRWDLLGVLADHPEDAQWHGCRVLGSLDAVAAFPAATLVCGASGLPPGISRLALVTRLGVELERFAAFIDPRAAVAEPEIVAAGSVVEAGAYLGPGCVVGMHCRIGPNAVVLSNAVLEPGATVEPGAVIGADVVVGHEAFIGAGAAVGDGVHIGARAVVGMGAVVTGDVPPGATWVGSPARSLRSVVTEAGS